MENCFEQWMADGSEEMREERRMECEEGRQETSAAPASSRLWPRWRSGSGSGLTTKRESNSLGAASMGYGD